MNLDPDMSNLVFLFVLKPQSIHFEAILSPQIEATSAAELQAAAHAMLRESRGECSSATKLFAKAGNYGKFKGNVERDIMRGLKLPLESCSFWMLLMYFISY